MADQCYELAAQVGDRLRNRGWMLATAESCTGGWIAKTMTDVPGSSGWFERGLVTYSNDAKIELLGVKRITLEHHGAVSGETVAEMAAGVLAHSRVQIAVAVSGIAGPDGGTPAKPVGTVWLAWAVRDEPVRPRRFQFGGNREAVRQQAVRAALEGMLDVLAPS